MIYLIFGAPEMLLYSPAPRCGHGFMVANLDTNWLRSEGRDVETSFWAGTRWWLEYWGLSMNLWVQWWKLRTEVTRWHGWGFVSLSIMMVLIGGFEMFWKQFAFKWMCGFIRKQLFENEPSTEDEFFPFFANRQVREESGTKWCKVESWWNIAET
jgi:hypothetical protein